jgi:hypothetical protein
MDMEDKCTDREFHRQLWLLFRFPTRRTYLSLEELMPFYAKFDRCQRIRNKFPQIWAEVKASRDRMIQERGFPPMDDTGKTEETDLEDISR